jgi:hypothetical protein
VDGAGRREAALFPEHERDAPRPLLDLLAAVTALRAARRVALGAVDAWQAAVLDAAAGEAGEPLGVRDRRGVRGERLQERLGPLHRPALEVVPVVRLALGERVGQALPEAQFTRGDPLAAAAALGAGARGRLDHMRHRYSSRRSTKHFR